MELSHFDLKELYLFNAIFFQIFHSLSQLNHQFFILFLLVSMGLLQLWDILIETPNFISFWHAHRRKLVDLAFEALAFVLCKILQIFYLHMVDLSQLILFFQEVLFPFDFYLTYLLQQSSSFFQQVLNLLLMFFWVLGVLSAHLFNLQVFVGQLLFYFLQFWLKSRHCQCIFSFDLFDSSW